MRTSFAGHFSIGTEEEIRKFAANIGDWNPLHHDRTEARNAGLRDIIAPGVMVVGFVSATIAREIPRVMIAELNLKFRRPLYSDSRPAVLCAVSSRKNRIAFVTITIKNGPDVIAEGSCTLLLPRK